MPNVTQVTVHCSSKHSHLNAKCDPGNSALQCSVNTVVWLPDWVIKQYLWHPPPIEPLWVTPDLPDDPPTPSTLPYDEKSWQELKGAELVWTEFKMWRPAFRTVWPTGDWPSLRGRRGRLGPGRQDLHLRWTCLAEGLFLVSCAVCPKNVLNIFTFLYEVMCPPEFALFWSCALTCQLCTYVWECLVCVIFYFWGKLWMVCLISRSILKSRNDDDMLWMTVCGWDVGRGSGQPISATFTSESSLCCPWNSPVAFERVLVPPLNLLSFALKCLLLPWIWSWCFC